ncbi:MAG: hypothetical protein AAGG08_16105, partial [Actinomycetota bacterium]
RTAYGWGMSAAFPDDARVLWTVDQRHPVSPDCNDNSLSSPVVQGEAFPTGHRMAPAHPGCRCMLQLVQH